MRPSRRFSHAIAEGDGISLLAEVDGPERAKAAAADGAEGIVVTSAPAAVSEASELPVLLLARSTPAEQQTPGADAAVIHVEGFEDEDGRLETAFAGVVEQGLDCVVAVRDEDELQLALDRLDPEIFLLLAPPPRDEEDEPLGRVLALLHDVPAGKLAIADARTIGGHAVAELERAGVDAVIVGAALVSELVGTQPRTL